jgi:hypothetical protein
MALKLMNLYPMSGSAKTQMEKSSSLDESMTKG